MVLGVTQAFLEEMFLSNVHFERNKLRSVIRWLVPYHHRVMIRIGDANNDLIDILRNIEIMTKANIFIKLNHIPKHRVVRGVWISILCSNKKDLMALKLIYK